MTCEPKISAPNKADPLTDAQCRFIDERTPEKRRADYGLKHIWQEFNVEFACDLTFEQFSRYRGLAMRSGRIERTSYGGRVHNRWSHKVLEKSQKDRALSRLRGGCRFFVGDQMCAAPTEGRYCLEHLGNHATDARELKPALVPPLLLDLTSTRS